MRPCTTVTILALAGCSHKNGAPAAADGDGDGYATADDCNDADDAIHPDAIEHCDGVDNDCDGIADGSDATDAIEYWADADTDGFGAGAPEASCTPPAGAVDNALDCDDSRADVNPDAAEVCDDVNADEDCDSLADDDDDSTDPSTASQVYVDADGDGYGGTDVILCDVGPEHVTIGGDCDDADATAYPGGTEICGNRVDNDCDAATCPLEGDAVTSDADTTIVADWGGSGLGTNVAPAGDVDGDGVGDLLVGSAWERAFLFRGPVFDTTTDDAAAELTGVSVDEHHGWDVHGMGDTDGDGYADIVVSAFTWSQDTGRVYLISGPILGTTTSDAAASTTISGAEEDDYLGWSSSSGDVDGDGSIDLVVSAPWAREREGDVYVFSGPVSEQELGPGDAKVTISGAVAEAFPGGTVAARGDLDGDGVHDLLINITNANCVALFLGPMNSDQEVVDSDVWVDRPSTTPWGGWLVAAAHAGDLDGDGLDDLAISAPVPKEVGEAWIVSGPTATATSILDPRKAAMATIRGDTAGDAFGTGLDTSGDLNVDGIDDVAIGAPGHNRGDGAAFVFYGPVSGNLTGADAGFRIFGDVNEHAGSLVRYTGDLDGNGATELALVSGVPLEAGGQSSVTLWYGGL